jgi:fused signal recognition particle receptor
MFGFIKKKLQTIYTQFTNKVSGLFAKETVDETTLNELEKALITADTGITTTRALLASLRQKIAAGTIEKGKDLYEALSEELISLLKTQPYDDKADVYLIVGINGSGKTTFISKLGYRLKNQGKTLLFVAADTFRAAATEQLAAWATALAIPLIKGKENQDPASVVFSGCQKYKEEQFDCLIIDTAGRLQTKINLMKELEKVKNSITKQLPNKKIVTLLTIDSMLGQNSFEQAKIFNESTHIDGIVLTKMDATGKGGIVFSITQELRIPIAFISYGESIEQLAPFIPEEYVQELLSKQ